MMMMHTDRVFDFFMSSSLVISSRSAKKACLVEEG